MNDAPRVISTQQSQSHPLLQAVLKQYKPQKKDSHKGQNGKLLLIGGSELFHAASKWSLDIASKVVDMVFYASTEENNALIHKVKGQFWNGIVVSQHDLSAYLQEADCVLIGPGMQRTQETKEMVDALLREHAHKKWVVDAGALQMVDPMLLLPHHIITPHQQEMEGVLERLDGARLGCSVVLKGAVDSIAIAGDDYAENQGLPRVLQIAGGNSGMTKGGTGDVLAGLLAALYTTQSALVSCVLASYCNKKAADELYTEVGPFFNASDLVAKVPAVLWGEIARV